MQASLSQKKDDTVWGMGYSQLPLYNQHSHHHHKWSFSMWWKPNNRGSSAPLPLDFESHKGTGHVSFIRIFLAPNTVSSYSLQSIKTFTGTEHYHVKCPSHLQQNRCLSSPTLRNCQTPVWWKKITTPNPSALSNTL